MLLYMIKRQYVPVKDILMTFLGQMSDFLHKRFVMFGTISPSPRRIASKISEAVSTG